MTLTGIDDGETPCRALDLASTGYTVTPNWVISIERQWMVELFETTDCSGEALCLQVEEDVLLNGLENIDWGQRIKSAIVPPGLLVEALESGEEGADWEPLHGDTSQPYACQILGGMAEEASSVLIIVPEDVDHDEEQTHADVEFYNKRNCGGPVMTRALLDDNDTETYDAYDLGIYSGDIYAIKARPGFWVEFEGGEDYFGELNGSFSC